MPSRTTLIAAWDTDRAACAYTADPGAVTASGSENPDTTPGRATDGNGTTRWSSNTADDAWIRVDLGATIRINQVTLEWEAAYGREYVLEVSKNGTDWTTFFTGTEGTGGTVTAHTHPQEVTGRYVRMRGIARATAWGYGDWTSSALHGPGYSADGNVGKSQTFPNGGRADQWHTYNVEWTPEGMTFTVDGQFVQRTSRQKLESTRGKWVFDHNQYVILNLALGGAYPAGHTRSPSLTGASRSPASTGSRGAASRRRATGCGSSRSSAGPPPGGRLDLLRAGDDGYSAARRSRSTRRGRPARAGCSSGGGCLSGVA